MSSHNGLLKPLHGGLMNCLTANTLGKDTKTGVFSFQRDELWFNLNADLLHNALRITPKDLAHPFVPPLDGDLIIDFVNNLGYPEELYFVSKMHVNNLYQPWRSILSMIDQCLTGKTFGSDKPIHYVLQMLWGVVTGTNVDYAELIWEKFIHAIKNFFSDMANLKVPTKKAKPPVILYCQFTKLIIYYLGGEEVETKKKALKADEEPQPTSELQVDLYRHRSAEWSFMNLTHGSSENSQMLKARERYYSTNDAETAADMEQSNSKNDTKILNVKEEHGEKVSNTEALEEKTVELDEGQAGSDPVHENLKLTTEEQVHIDNLPSLSKTLSSMKNLEDAFTFGD
ncbi:hypothetical protein Tco_0461475 [Tanacetum coccineum]